MTRQEAQAATEEATRWSREGGAPGNEACNASLPVSKRGKMRAVWPAVRVAHTGAAAKAFGEKRDLVREEEGEIWTSVRALASGEESQPATKPAPRPEAKGERPWLVSTSYE